VVTGKEGNWGGSNSTGECKGYRRRMGCQENGCKGKKRSSLRGAEIRIIARTRSHVERNEEGKRGGAQRAT